MLPLDFRHRCILVTAASYHRCILTIHYFISCLLERGSSRIGMNRIKVSLVALHDLYTCDEAAHDVLEILVRYEDLILQQIVVRMPFRCSLGGCCEITIHTTDGFL